MNEIKEIYEKYKHLDKLLSDSEWGGENDIQFSILYNLWEAIKGAQGDNVAPDVAIKKAKQGTQEKKNCQTCIHFDVHFTSIACLKCIQFHKYKDEWKPKTPTDSGDSSSFIGEQGELEQDKESTMEEDCGNCANLGDYESCGDGRRCAHYTEAEAEERAQATKDRQTSDEAHKDSTKEKPESKSLSEEE